MSSSPTPERIAVYRRPGLAGVELLTVQQSARGWNVYNTNYGIAVLHRWSGRVDYRGRQTAAEFGQLFCAEPGELHCATPRARHAGSFNVFQIEQQVFAEQCAALDLRAQHWTSIVAAPARTPAALRDLQLSLEGEASSIELQSRLANVFHVASQELFEVAPRKAPARAPLRAVERLRELLHSNESSRLKLVDFARDANVSQFQLLRSFKRRYGLPPHAYELSVRVSRARSLLRSGCSVSEAAAQTQFVDQSHLTRHFRRVVGITPGSYARGPRSCL